MSNLKAENDYDVGRRLKREAVDLCRRVDDVCSRSSAVSHLFTPTSTALRLRLRDVCERLILNHTAEHGRQAEEMLWRKVHHDPFVRARRLSQQDGERDEVSHLLICQHLLAGIGSYQQLLNSSHKQFPPLNLTIDLCPPGKRGLQHEIVGGGVEVVSTELRLGCDCVQRLLICLGDLTRYLSDTDPDTYTRSTAAAYYSQAALVLPSVGRPYNQLGTLLSSDDCALPAVYQFLRALTCGQPLTAARHNLLQLLRHNHETRTSLDVEHGNSAVSSLQRLLVTFLDVIYGATLMQHAKQHRLVRLCQETLQWLMFCLTPRQSTQRNTPSNHTTDSSPNVRPTSNCLLLMVSVTAMAIQTASGDQEMGVSVLRALLLAVFSCLLSDVTTFVTSHFASLESVCGAETLAVNTGCDLSQKQRARPKRDLRRQRATQKAHSGTDSEDDEQECFDDSMSDTESAFSSDDDDDDDDHDDVEKETSNHSSTPSSTELIQVLQKYDIWAPLYVCCVWLRANETVLIQCRENSGSLWRQLATLGNTVSAVLAANNKCSNNVTTTGCSGGDHVGARLAHMAPLPEDWLLRGLPLLGSRHEQLSWQLQQLQMTQPSYTDQVLLRCQLIREFFQWLTEHDQLSHVISSARLSDSRLIFVYNNQQSMTSPDNDVIDKKSNTADADKPDGQSSIKLPSDRQRTLMSGMAELWLQAEVRSLRQRTTGARHWRRRSRKGGSSPLSPYLVPDTAALVGHLGLLRKLAASRQFVIVIPAVVVHELDERKSVCVGARDASRWLEQQLRRGSRHVRPQRAHEKTSLQPLTYPRRSHRQHWRFFQILECCRHLSDSLSSVTPLTSSLTDSVTLLLGKRQQSDLAGQQPGTEPPLSVATLTAAAGIRYEYINQFHAKWRGDKNG